MVDYSVLIGALFALMGAIAAYFQRAQKLDAIKVADSAVKTKNDVVAFFDPGSNTKTSSDVVESLPGRSWKMTDETKRWITFDHSPSEQASLLQQIADAEAQKKTDYVISAGDAYYHIEYGLLSGSGKGAGKAAQ